MVAVSSRVEAVQNDSEHERRYPVCGACGGVHNETNIYIRTMHAASCFSCQGGEGIHCLKIWPSTYRNYGSTWSDKHYILEFITYDYNFGFW